MTTYNITGIGVVPSNSSEYTTGSVAQIFAANINTLQTIFGITSSNPNPNLQTLSAADYDQVIAAINNLALLAQNGQLDPISGTPYYLTAQMAIALNLLMQSLQAAGIPPANAPTTDAQKISLIKGWQSLSSFGVSDILQNAQTSSVGATRTLQSLVQIEYVGAGNQYLAQQLSSLNAALSTTNSILNSLGVVQNISNEITINPVGTFTFPPVNDSGLWVPGVGYTALAKNIASLFLQDLNNPSQAQPGTFVYVLSHEVQSAGGGSIDNLTGASNIVNAFQGQSAVAYEHMYRVFASTQFGQVVPVAAPSSTAATDLLAAKQQLMNEIALLEQQNPGVTRTTPGSLAYFIYQVALDISAAFSSINTQTLTGTALQTALTSAVSAWIVDNQNQPQGSTGSNQAGASQTKIQTAENAAQGLNDQQKQLVQVAEFNFEQFYRSASDVLNGINSIIQAMANAIGRG